MAITIYPLNDLTIPLLIKGLSSDGQSTFLYTDTPGPAPTAFLATSNAPTATAANVALNFTVTYVSPGAWLLFLDASVLTFALLDGLFASTSPVLIIQIANGSREYLPCTYAPSRAAVSA